MRLIARWTPALLNEAAAAFKILDMKRTGGEETFNEAVAPSYRVTPTSSIPPSLLRSLVHVTRTRHATALPHSILYSPLCTAVSSSLANDPRYRTSSPPTCLTPALLPIPTPHRWARWPSSSRKKLPMLDESCMACLDNAVGGSTSFLSLFSSSPLPLSLPLRCSAHY